MALSSACGQDLSGLVKSRQRNYYGTENSDKEDPEKLVKLPLPFFVTVFLFPLNEFLRKIRHEPDISHYVHRKNRAHEKHGSGADDQGRIETYTYEVLNWDSGLAGEIYDVCEEIFEKHLTVLMFTMLYIYSHPPVDVQRVCLDIFESVEKKNPP